MQKFRYLNEFAPRFFKLCRVNYISLKMSIVGEQLLIDIIAVVLFNFFAAICGSTVRVP